MGEYGGKWKNNYAAKIIIIVSENHWSQVIQELVSFIIQPENFINYVT